MQEWGRVRRVVASTVTAALVGTLVLVAPGVAQAARSDRLMSDAERRAHGAEVAGEREETDPLPSRDGTIPVDPLPEMPGAEADPAAWPEAAATTLDAGATEAAGEVVSLAWADPAAVGATETAAPAPTETADPAPAEVSVEVLDRADAEDAGVEGVLLSVESGAEAADAPVDVTVDYTEFAGAFGGDWASRLQLVALPECALTDPEAEECRTRTPVESSNDPEAGTVTATVAPASARVMALAATTSGSTGNWSATPLSPSASWQVSGQTGDFSWSYPMRVPPVSGGPQPDLAFSYSSGSLDGRVASTNNQTSWVGDGWNLDSGYVERKYQSCFDDMGANANNAGHRTGDQCWFGDNATLVFGGSSTELVKDATTGAWRPKADDGSRVERLTGGWNDDNDGEYWRLTTTDGTQYYFGRGKRSAADALQLNSTWSVPVYGNHPGDPCYAPTFAGSSCTQAWRWNLEYVVDPSGNTLTYVYEKETNNYGRNNNEAVSSYVRGGFLTRIEYGQRAGAESASPAPARVDFTVAERCLPSGSITCDPAQLTEENAKSWPDVPADLICSSGSSCAEQTSPSFFTRKRLVSVKTRVLDGSSYRDVDAWNLRHTFPDTGDRTNAALWLDGITHQGLAGSTITLPEVTFRGAQMANRVDATGDAGPPMNRYRVTAIGSESGGTVTINYSAPDCAPGNVPGAADSNTRRCFPVTWQPEGTGPEIQEYFHKYVVDTVVENPNDEVSPAVETAYRYVGDPAWHYDDNPLAPPAHRTWSEWRGYGTVDVLTGSPLEQRSHERTRYFRGMDGDRLAGGGTRQVAVDGIPDQERLNGFVREEITYDGVDGPEVGGSITTPWVSGPTAVGADGARATFLEPASVEERTAAPALPGGVRTTRTVTSYDGTYGMVTQVDDQGDVSTAADDRCTRVEYARNTAAHVVATVRRSETVSVACAATPTRPGQVVADERTLYDGGAFGAAPTRGLPSATQVLSAYSGTTPTYATTSTTTYDALGRPTVATDAMGRASTTAYTGTAGMVTGTTVTAPDPDGAGALTAAVTKVDLDPAWGSTVKVTDPNGKVTSATFDALGRTTAVWHPGRAQGSKSAHVTYGYTISKTAPNTVTTSTLTAGETYLTSVELYDGMLRPRQTQSPSAARDTPGRLVTDTYYDSRGNTAKTHGAWFTNGAPATTLVVSSTAVPQRTRFVYDGAGRETVQITDVGEKEVWRTTTSYGGDRVSVDPPAGGTPQTTITDARGQTTELRQYLGATPSGTYRSSTYGYDKAGNLTSVKDATGNTWTYAYDLRGRQTSATDPDKGATTTTYDDAGLMQTSKDARGTTLYYVRDQLGRQTELRETSATGALRAKWSYDTLQKGQLTSSTRYSGTAAYVTAVTGYDDASRPLGASVTLPSTEGALAGTYTTSYTYTADGQVQTVKLPAGGGLNAETVTTRYDALSQPEWMSGGLGWGVYVAGSLYDVYGEPLRYDLGNTYSFKVNYAYEEGTRRLQKTWVEREGVAGLDMDLTYAYDQMGNPTSVVDRPTGKAVDAQCFAYDGLRQLTSAWTPADANCGSTRSVATLGGPAPYWIDYTLDAAGNRTSEVVHTAGGDTTRTYAYPAAGAARPHAVTAVTQAGAGGAATSSYAYDAAGNTTTRNVAGAAGQTLKWDAEGRLESITQGTTTVMQALYTADGDRLIRRQGGVTTVYLPGGQELSLTTATKVVKGTRYYSFDGQNIAMRTGMSGSTVSSLVADPHQTATISIANTTKAVTQRRTDPYGNARGTATGTWPGDRGFLNKVQDSSGLTQVGARYYDAKIGRFISVDPVFDMASPQQWGAYSYADNNPVSFSDPTGLLSLGKMWSSAKKKASSAWKSTTRFVKKYQAEIVGGVTGAVVTGGCLFVTAGAGSVGCAALGGAAAGAATNLWRSKVQKTQAFSWASLARDTGMGALAGAAGGVLGKVAAAAAPAIRQGVAAAAARASGAVTSGARAAVATVRSRVSTAVAGGSDRGSINLFASAGRSSTAGDVAAASGDDWANVSGILRDAARGKGNFGVGRGTAAEARDAGQAWVGDGARLASDGKTWLSQDGLRQWRPPSFKPNWGGGTWQSNFESRWVPRGQWQTNGHLDIIDMP
ncbi:RHS repeat-associated core domain-containing protein [Cellulomonas pakistanensis]|uniref:Type IV secretion protein Rhs n=1 Tax=Cellulomonas pakistanensis TaxID=992287 RepID=A0A919P9D7_9CELL|nr:RHS repeat-associated core domain-containing protein [Cellulomonas pakistanensis]GIG34834.1 type IV secretion protein Rhs [Cellulomonas pakistanensis]